MARRSAEPKERLSVRAWFRDTYLSFDRRTLGFTRILIGWLLLGDLARRLPHWTNLYSNEGVLPSHIALHRQAPAGNVSLTYSFSTNFECWAYFALCLASHLCLLVGYRTRIAQITSLVLQVSLNGRVLLVENGGYVVENLLLLWTTFLPLGDRFSVDALLASLRTKRERTAEDLADRFDPTLRTDAHVSILGLAIVVQLWAIYFFNVVHKYGEPWRDGTAVHYVLYVDRMVTPIVAATREHIPWTLLLVATRVALSMEALSSILVWLPVARVWARRLLIVNVNALHLGFGTTFVLGPFAWSACVLSTLFFSAEDWEIAARTMRRKARARTVLFDPASGAAFLACRVLARLDRFELLGFEARADLGAPLGVVRRDEAPLVRAPALAEIVAALPLGPGVAWLFRVPGISHVVDAALRAGEALGPSRWFGIGSSIETEAPIASPWLERAKRPFVWLREASVVLVLAACINQGVVEMWVVREAVEPLIKARWGPSATIPQPGVLAAITKKPRFLQGWFMFSPVPVMDDGNLVVDALTVDGRRVDPLTGKPPDFDLGHAKSFRYDQIWSDYCTRIAIPGNSLYRDALRDWVIRWPERTGRPEDRLVRFEVHALRDENPRFGTHQSVNFTDQKLFSWQAPPSVHAGPSPSPASRDANGKGLH